MSSSATARTSRSRSRAASCGPRARSSASAELDQVLDVACRARDRRLDIRSRHEVVLGGPGSNLVDRTPAHGLVAHDPTLADLLATDLELRLDERDDRLARWRAQQLADARQDERQRDERDVDHREVTRLGHLLELGVADVLALEHDDARIAAQRPRELPVA